ncbi:hypothetical protein AAMO2058_001578000 [Amorphochlora amoebiformis]
MAVRPCRTLAALLVMVAGSVNAIIENHNFMDDEHFAKIQDFKYILENNYILIFRCDVTEEEQKKWASLESNFNVFGEAKSNIRMVNLDIAGEDLKKLAKDFGIGERGRGCPTAVYLPRWLSLKESISTNSYEITRDLSFDDDHLIQWIWHHMDIKAYAEFESHIDDTIEVFWADPIHKKEWPTFTLKPQAREKRNVQLGHQFFFRKRKGRKLAEATFTVSRTWVHLEVQESKIDWIEMWADDPDHPEKMALAKSGENPPGIIRGSSVFQRRRGRHLQFHFRGNPALVVQAFLGSLIGAVMLLLFIISTIVRFLALMRETVIVARRQQIRYSKHWHGAD